jgi:hypothetical protein
MSGFVGRQRGLGMLGIMALLGLGALVVTLGVRLGPPYMQYLTVKSAMNAVSEDVELKGKGRTEVMSALGRRLDVNSVSGLPPQAFRVEQKDFGQKLIADYEVRVHLFFNIDAVLSFDYQVALGRQ